MKKNKPVGTPVRGILDATGDVAAKGSVVNPSAPYTTSCCPGNKHLSAIVSTAYRILQNKDEEITHKLCLELQMLYGLRISEVLNITTSNILHDNAIYIKGLKNSQNRIIRSVYFDDYINKIKKNPGCQIFYFNRWHAYRWYRKKGIYYKFGHNTVTSVTHFFRHYLILMQKNEGIDIEDIQKNIGHKSVKSTEVYERS